MGKILDRGIKQYEELVSGIFCDKDLERKFEHVSRTVFRTPNPEELREQTYERIFGAERLEAPKAIIFSDSSKFRPGVLLSEGFSGEGYSQANRLLQQEIADSLGLLLPSYKRLDYIDIHGENHVNYALLLLTDRQGPYNCSGVDRTELRKMRSFLENAVLMQKVCCSLNDVNSEKSFAGASRALSNLAANCADSLILRTQRKIKDKADGGRE